MASIASHRSRASPVAALPQHEADGVHPVGEVVADHREEHEQPGRRVHVEREADPEPVQEAVEREAGRAERADARVRPRLLGLVAVVEDEHAFDEEEADEPGTDERHHAARRVDQVERLRQDVEERDRDDDAAGERDHRRELLAQAERDEPAEHRRDRGRDRERDGEPGHGASTITPSSSA